MIISIVAQNHGFNANINKSWSLEVSDRQRVCTLFLLKFREMPLECTLESIWERESQL